MLVVCAASLQVCQYVERELAIMFRVINFLGVSFRFSAVAVLYLGNKAPWLFAFGNVHQETSMYQTEVQAEFLAEFIEALFKVAALLELFSHPGISNVLLIMFEFLTFETILILSCLKDCIGSQHAGLHGVVSAFDLGDVQETRRTPSKHAAWESQLRNSMVTSLIKNSGTIRNALAAFKHSSHHVVCLESLKFFVRIEIRVLVIKADNHTQMNQIRLHVVHKRATVNVCSQRPSNRVLHVPLGKVRVAVFDLPDFLEANAVVLLTCCIFIELEVLLKPFC